MSIKKKAKRHNKNKTSKKVTIILAVIIILIIVVLSATKSLSSPPDNDTTIIPFTVNEGDSYSDVGNNLYEQGFIKSKLMYKIYIKLKKPDMLYSGDYPLSKSMELKEVIDIIASGQTYVPYAFYVTFPEGKNIIQISNIIAENTNHSQEEFFNLLKDKGYLDELINEYWFLTDEIKNDDIYYSLEGYLFPDTYQFSDEDMPLKDILEAMLNQTDVVLSDYKDDIQASSFTIHEMLTLASIVELEAGNDQDRADVAGVFYNRLKIDMALGSDVTSYYGAKVDMVTRDLYYAELNDHNPYNTRNSDMIGLPVGPICCPGASSIIAAIEPNDNDYYFFVSDINKNTHFTKTYEEHEAKIEELQDEGLWFTYE